MAHKGQLFNSLQSDEHWGADIDERCRSYRQKLLCWQENVRNSWRMSTSISCMLTHSLCSSFVSPDHSNCLKRECKGRCVFHLFYSIFVRKLEKERSPQDLQVGGGRGEGGGWPSRGKVLTREKRRKKTEGAPQKIGSREWLCMMGAMWKHETELVHKIFIMRHKSKVDQIHDNENTD